MHDTTTTTASGHEVLVLDDEAFAALAGLDYPSRSFSQAMIATPPRAALLRALWMHGRFEDRSGFAAAKLAEAARIFEPGFDSGSSSILSAPSLAACVERQTKARKTYSVQLVAMPSRWIEQLGLTTPEPEPEPVEELATVIEMPAPIEEPPTVPTEMANAVATALLARVVEVLATGSASGPQLAKALADLETASQRLYSQTEYAERLRRQRDEAGDMIAALKVEVDGLRRRLRETEHNLSVATGADAQRIIDAEVRKQLDKLMRQAPASQHAHA